MAKIQRKMYERCLEIDMDFRPTKAWIRAWIKVHTNTLSTLGYTVGELIIKKKGRGLHVWWQVSKEKPFTEDEVNMVHWVLNDDVTRVRINRYRTRRGMKVFWSKLFAEVLWRKPLPENCQKCHLIKTLREMEGQLEKEEEQCPEIVRFNPADSDVNTLKIRIGK